MNQRLKTAVPEYGTKMDDVSAKTRAFKGVARKLKDETSARSYIRRMMMGKDPEGMKALKEFDQVAGTGYSQELQDSFTKEQFMKERPNGSRRTNMYANWGEASGIPFGKAVGGAIGYGQDIYGGRVAKLLLDIASTGYLGKAGEMLNRASRRGPQAALATHRWLMDNDKAYQSQIDALKQEDQP